MNYKLKKVLIGGVCILAPTAVIGFSTATYFTTTSDVRITNEGIYIERINGELVNEGYQYDFSSTYGGYTATDPYKQLLMNEVIHLKSSGQFEYDAINDKVISPSYESMKFEIGSSIVLTFINLEAMNDSNKKVSEEDLKDGDFIKKNINNPDVCFQLFFDDDDDSLVPPHSTTSLVQLLGSKKPRSINNQEVFWKIINNGYLGSKPDLDSENVNIDTSSKKFALVNMGFTFKKNVNWVDWKGEKTKYQVVPRDMYYSIWRTWLYDYRNRAVLGGSKAIDDYFIKEYKVKNKLTQNKKYPNAYLFDFFGLNLKNDVMNEKRAIQSIYENPNKIKDEAFTFWFELYDQNKNIRDDFSYSIKDILQKYLTTGTEFCLAPSQYIDEKFGSNSSLNEIIVKNSEGNEEKQIIKDECAKFGIYTYGATTEETLFASRYTPIESKDNRIIYQYNKYNANKEWVDSVEKGITINDQTYKSLRQIIIEYTGGIDDITYKNQSFSSFINGGLSAYGYQLLTEAQRQVIYGNGSTKNELIEYALNKGLRPGKTTNNSSCLTRLVWASIPIKQDRPEDYTFNDKYAQVVFGSSMEDIMNGTATTGSSFYAGNGMKFKSLVQSSINWVTFIERAYGGQKDVWLCGAPQDAKFSSFVSDSLSSRNFFNYKELEYDINNLKYWDPSSKDFKTVTYKEMLDAYTSINIPDEWKNNVNQYKLLSPKFKEIQVAVKKLLDELGIKENERIKWDVPFAYLAKEANTKTDVTSEVVEVIKLLDKRIEPTFIRPTTRDEYLKHIIGHVGGYAFNGWGYDYEGLGSWIASFSSDSPSTNIFSAIGVFSKETDTSSPNYDASLFGSIEKPDFSTGKNVTYQRMSLEEVKAIQKQFPKFTELAKYVKKEMNTVWKRGGIDIETEASSTKWFNVKYWDLLTTQELSGLSDFFKNSASIDPVAKVAAIYKSFESAASWETSTTDVEEKGKGWVSFIQEMNCIKGVSIDIDQAVSKLSKISYRLFLKEYVIPITSNGLTVMSDWQYEVKNIWGNK